MKSNAMILVLFILILPVSIYAQNSNDSYKIIKNIKEYKIIFDNSLKKNDTILWKEINYDSTGKLTEEKDYENKRPVALLIKTKDGSCGRGGVFDGPTPCDTEITKSQSANSKLLEEEHWCICSNGKHYYKNVYLYDETTGYLLTINKYNIDNIITETTFYVYKFY